MTVAREQAFKRMQFGLVVGLMGSLPPMGNTAILTNTVKVKKGGMELEAEADCGLF